MKKNFKKVICGMFAVMLMITSMIVPASATNVDDVLGSITVHYVDEGTKIENDKYVENKVLIDGATFSAVMVAEEANGYFEWIDLIKEDTSFGYKAEDMFNKDKIADIAKELVSIFGEKFDTSTKTTGEDGTCKFNELERGIYLVWESSKDDTAEDYSYSVPFLVEVPNRENNPFDFDVHVYPKGSKLVVKMITVTGTKSWKGNDIVGKKDDSTDKDDKTTKDEDVVYRPDSITLRLYADGKEVAKTTTNAEKEWAFSFNKVNALNEKGEEVTFTIKEDEVKGYTFTQSDPKVGENTIVINVTNTVGEPAAKTGDESNMKMWIAIIGGCVALAAIVLMIPSNKKEKEEKSIAEKKVEKVTGINAEEEEETQE